MGKIFESILGILTPLVIIFGFFMGFDRWGTREGSFSLACALFLTLLVIKDKIQDSADRIIEAIDNLAELLTVDNDVVGLLTKESSDRDGNSSADSR